MARHFDRRIIIKVQVKELFISLFILLLGIIIWSMTSTYSNSAIDVRNQYCPAMDGKIYDWTANLGNLLIALGVLGISICGFLPKILLGCQCRMESVCCAAICMSSFGKALDAFGLFVILLYNIYGGKIYQEIPNEIQSTDHELFLPGGRLADQNSIEIAKNYCNENILNLFKGMVIFIFSFFGLGVILGIIACIKNLRSKSRHGDENLAQSDLETGKLRKIDRKWAKALGIDLKPKEEK